MAQSTDPIGNYNRADVLGLLDEFSDILVSKMKDAEGQREDYSSSASKRQASHATEGSVMMDPTTGEIVGGGIQPRTQRPNSGVSEGASQAGSGGKDRQAIRDYVSEHADSKLSIHTASDEAKELWVRHQKRKDSPEGGMLPTFFGGSVNWQQAATGAAELGDALQSGKVMGRQVFSGFDEDSLGYRVGGMLSEGGRQVENNALAIEAVRSFGRRLSAESNKLSGYGQSLGAVEGQGLGSSVGPFRPPFISPGARKGAQATVDSLVSGVLTPGLSPLEDLQIKGSLGGMGWYDGTEEADDILGKGYGANKGGLRELFSYDPRLNNDLTMQQVDQGVRHGTPMDQLSATLKQIDPAARAANASFEQMQSAMSTMGDQAIASGGKMINGMNNAIQWAAVTGTNSEVGAALQENSYVQGRTYRDTGVTPQMQGMLNSGVKTQSTLNAVNEMWGNVGAFPQKVIRDNQGNVLQVLDGKDQKAAMVGEALGVDAQAVKRLRDKKLWGKYKNGLNVESLGQGSADSFNKAADATENDNMSAYRKWVREGSKSTKAGIKAMSGAVDVEGEKLYDDEEIETVKNAGSAIKGLDLSEDDLNITDCEARSVATWLA